MNFRDRYEFDPETYTGEGGLSGMLRAAIQQYGTDGDPAANVGPGSASENSASPQGGMLGRFSLDAEQSQSRPVSDSVGQTPLAIRNPNLNIPSWAATAGQPQGTIGPSNLLNGQSNPNYSAFGDGAALDLLRTSQMQHDRYQPSGASRNAACWPNRLST